MLVYQYSTQKGKLKHNIAYCLCSTKTTVPADGNDTAVSIGKCGSGFDCNLLSAETCKQTYKNKSNGKKRKKKKKKKNHPKARDLNKV